MMWRVKNFVEEVSPRLPTLPSLGCLKNIINLIKSLDQPSLDGIVHSILDYNVGGHMAYHGFGSPGCPGNTLGMCMNTQDSEELESLGKRIVVWEDPTGGAFSLPLSHSLPLSLALCLSPFSHSVSHACVCMYSLSKKVFTFRFYDASSWASDP